MTICQNSDTPLEGYPLLMAINARCHELEAFSANHPWVIRDRSGTG